MQSLYIKATEDSPEIILDVENNKMLIKGESYPENTFEFYEPILNWLKEYFKTNDKKLKVEMDFIYCNSATTQVLFDIFDILNENKEKISTIKWYHDGEDSTIYEDYEEFADEFSDLNIIPVQRES